MARFRVRLTQLRDQLRSRVLAPFLSWYRGQLDQLGRGWTAVANAAKTGAANVRAGWEADLARIRSGLSSVRDVGERAFRGIADRAAPHLARVRTEVERLTRPFAVVRAYGTGAFRVLGDSGAKQLERVAQAGERAATRISTGLRRVTRPARDIVKGFREVQNSLDRSATLSRRFGGALSTSLIQNTMKVVALTRRFGEWGERTGGVARLVRRDIDRLTRSVSVGGRGLDRLGKGLSGLGSVGKIAGGLLSGVGKVVDGLSEGFSVATGGAGSLTGALDLVKGGAGNLAGAAAQAGQMVFGFGLKLAQIGVIAGTVTYAIGAAGAALTALPGLALGAAAMLGTVALGMDGIKRAYDKSLKPAVDGLKKQLSEVFERKFDTAFRTLSTKLIPGVTDSLKRMAGAIGDGANQLADFLTRSDNLKAINRIVDTMADLVTTKLVPSLKNIVGSLLEIGSNSSILTSIADIFTDLSDKTALWLHNINQSGQAERSLKSLREVLGAVEDVLFTVVTKAMEFAEAAGPGVRDAFNGIKSAIDKVDFRSLGDSFGKVARAAGKLIDSIPPAAWNDITNAVKGLADKVTEFANDPGMQAAAASIVSALGYVIGAVTTVIGWFESLTHAVQSVTRATASVTDALGITEGAVGRFDSALGKVPAQVQSAMDGAAAAARSGAAKVEDGVRIPIAALPGLTQAEFDKLSPIVQNGLRDASLAVQAGAPPIPKGMQGPLSEIPGIAQSEFAKMSPIVQDQLRKARDAAAAGAAAVPPAVQNPLAGVPAQAQQQFGQVPGVATSNLDTAASAAAAGAGKVSASVDFKPALDAATNVFGQLPKTVSDGVGRAASAAEGGANRISAALRSGLDSAASAAEGGARRISTSVRSGLDAAAGAAEAGARRVTTAVRTGMDQAAAAAEKGGQRVRQALEQSLNASVKLSEDSWRRITQAFQQGGDRAAQIATDTGRKCVDAIRNQAGAMYQAGYTLISRLADGMIAAQGKATAAAARTAASIKAQFPSSPPKEGPLSGQGDPLLSGGKIVRRLASGIAAQAAAAPAALRPMLAKVATMLDSLGLGTRSSLPAGTLTPIIGNLSKKMAAVGATAAAKSDNRKVRVDFGTVPNSVWDKLIKMGYRGDPNDGREALYVPRSVLNSLTHPGRGTASSTRQPQRRYEGRMTSMVRDAGPSTVRPRGDAEAQAAAGPSLEEMQAVLQQALRDGIAEAVKPISATGLARINAKGQKELSRL